MTQVVFRYVCLAFVAGVLAVNQSVQAGSHLWRINEVYSNWDGTVQFIELHECCGASAELALLNKKLVSAQTGHIFNIPANLTGNTANKYLLFGTSAFAALPGAPTPNYIIPSNFFAINGDTIQWSPIDNYDTFTYVSGNLPVNGIDSIQVTNWATDTFTTSANSPTNYAGVSGSVNAGPPVPAVSTWGMIVVALLVLSAGTIVLQEKAAQISSIQ